MSRRHPPPATGTVPNDDADDLTWLQYLQLDLLGSQKAQRQHRTPRPISPLPQFHLRQLPLPKPSDRSAQNQRPPTSTH
ncbi:hypothetical protein LTR27_007590 [Elasticomyces elasticus]|nr:hypothetical protein LTR27_007590 [Elasticomyces elasticus]